MADKPISSLLSGENQLFSDRFSKAGIFQIKDLLCKSPIELVNTLNISLGRIDSLFDLAYKNISIRNVTALELSNRSSQQNETTFFEIMIKECGLLTNGMLCELCGPPGVGKTQFLFQVGLSALMSDPNSSAIFIDTENNFSPERLAELARCKLGENYPHPLRRMFVLRAFTIEDFEKKLGQIEILIFTNKTRVVIIDSLASIVRREFSSTDSTTLHERSIFLSRVSSRLKTLAEFLNITVLITNQIVSKMNCDDGSVQPALGSSWTHFVNIRLVLQYLSDQTRELIIAKSPFSPSKRYTYTISSLNGVELQDCQQDDDQFNLNNQKIRVKPYSSLSEY